MFTAFLPGASKDALKRMSEEIHSWRIHLRSGTELGVHLFNRCDLALMQDGMP